MNINKSIALSLGYGLLSSKLSREITHRKNNIQKLDISSRNLLNLGFVRNFNLATHKFKSSLCESPDLGNNLDRSLVEDVDLESLSQENLKQSATTEDSVKGDLSNEENTSDQIEGNLTEDLLNLINVNSEIIKNKNEDLNKYDWFDDEPIDSSDEELMNEYYETKIPDYNSIYKNLDPVGLRKFCTNTSDENGQYTSISDSFLGRVYEVGEPLLDEESLKCKNTHTLEELGAADNPKLKEISENKMDDDNYMENYEGVEEFDVGEEFQEDSDDVCIEDDMCRFFVKVPLKNWTKEEIGVFKELMVKEERSEKYHTKLDTEKLETDFKEVFANSPNLPLGIFDSVTQETNTEDSEKYYDISQKGLKNIKIREYNHNDLLNDIDKYEKSEYPKIIHEISKDGENKTIFSTKESFEEDFEENTGSICEDLEFYVGVPKDFVQFDQLDSHTVSDSFVFRRNYEDYVGEEIERIPLKEDFYCGLVLLPNEAGFRDQNVRYLADELAIISKSLVFIPNILPTNGRDEGNCEKLNRLLKLIQVIYKIDRLSIVALGNQGNPILEYINSSLNENSSVTRENTDKNEYTKLERLINNQTVPIIEDLLNGIENIKVAQSYRISKKLRDLNIVKPISRILQTVVLYDTNDINLEILVNIETPSLILASNKKKLIDSVVSTENFNNSMGKPNSNIGHLENLKGVNVFDKDKGVSEKGENSLNNLIEKYQLNLKFIPGNFKDIQQYYLTTIKKGIDIVLYVFKKASPNFFMKKPNSSKSEFQAIKDSIVYCANWIRSWTY